LFWSIPGKPLCLPTVWCPSILGERDGITRWG
jgi:hypothetical protein